MSDGNIVRILWNSGKCWENVFSPRTDPGTKIAWSFPREICKCLIRQCLPWVTALPQMTSFFKPYQSPRWRYCDVKTKQNKTKHSSGLEEAICAMVTWTIDQFHGYRVTLLLRVVGHWSSDMTDVLIKAVSDFPRGPRQVLLKRSYRVNML